MLEIRETGHNVLHLIYPIRWKNKEEKIDGNRFKRMLEKRDDWCELFKKDATHNYDTPAFHQYFASFYEKPAAQSGSYRDIIPTRQVIEYFHPSVQDMLFHEENHPFTAYVCQQQPKLLQFMLSEKVENSKGQKETFSEKDFLQVEWVSSEIYSFDNDLGFFVARLCLKEIIEDEDGLIIGRHDLNTYMKFVNRIRQNYKKYALQSHLVLSSEGETKPFYFIEEVRSLIKSLSNDSLIVSNVQVSPKVTKDNNFYVEPNTFVHSFVKTNISNDGPLSEAELYQVIHIDDYKGESGGTEAFYKQFVNNNVYNRWENMHTHYTAIDYGAMTIMDGQNNKYVNTQANLKGNSGYDFADLAYQHHCRQYLLFIVLQQHYRETLQEIQGEYARLSGILDEQAKEIANSFYKLNQTFYFKRISQEVQGRELWNFYYKIFDIEELMKSAQYDIQELNARSIEAINSKQSKDVMKLTMITIFTGLLGMNILIPLFSGTRESTSEFIQDHSEFIQEHSWANWLSKFRWEYATVFGVGVTILIMGYLLFAYVEMKKAYKKTKK